MEWSKWRTLKNTNIIRLFNRKIPLSRRVITGVWPNFYRLQFTSLFCDKCTLCTHCFIGSLFLHFMRVRCNVLLDCSYGFYNISNGNCLYRQSIRLCTFCVDVNMFFHSEKKNPFPLIITFLLEMKLWFRITAP